MATKASPVKTKYSTKVSSTTKLWDIRGTIKGDPDDVNYCLRDLVEVLAGEYSRPIDIELDVTPVIEG